MRSLPHDLDLTNGTIVVKFFAEWCGPCKLYAPVFERTAARNPEVDFYELDVDQAPEIQANFGVESIPSTVILRDGVIVKREAGAKSSRQLDELVQEALHYPHGTIT